MTLNRPVFLSQTVPKLVLRKDIEGNYLGIISGEGMLPSFSLFLTGKASSTRINRTCLWLLISSHTNGAAQNSVRMPPSVMFHSILKKQKPSRGSCCREKRSSWGPVNGSGNVLLMEELWQHLLNGISELLWTSGYFYVFHSSFWSEVNIYCFYLVLFLPMYTELLNIVNLFSGF